ncbi:MAG: alpha/beta fold hydrolase [Roseiflexaceae bacterium]|nr:alpha/beta fold hydrolase [Roseiflexaceae bacterium]
MSESHQTEPTAPGASVSPAAEDYIRVMRHELRTPVNHIIGYSEMLLDEFDDADSGPVAPLRRIEASGRQLLIGINRAIETAAGDPRLLERTLRHDGFQALIEQILDEVSILERDLADGAQSKWLPDVRRVGSGAANLRDLITTGLHHAAVETGVREAAIEERAIENEPVEQAQGTLLVVEDNELNRDMLTRRLVRLGYHVIIAENGRRALEVLAEQPTDLILLDIMMPELNGYQALEQIKQNPALRHIPVIMLSALDELASVVRCIEMGADDYLPKPFDPVLLRARISACLEKKHFRDQEQDYLKQIKIAKKRADDLLHVVIPIGVALSAEKGYNRLLEKIVVEAMGLCNADGGSLYMRTDEDLLEFVILRNHSLNIMMGGTSETPLQFPPLRMYDPETREPNRHYVVTQAALKREAVMIDDAYDAVGFDFSGTRAFDLQTGYRSMSFLAVPLLDNIGRVIGVLQLLNAQDLETGAGIPFDHGMREMIESLSALAAAALTVYEREQRLRDQIAKLQVAIDQEKRKREVDQITETDYFQRLQSRARELRAGSGTARQNIPSAPVPELTPAIPAAAVDPATQADPADALPVIEEEVDPLLAPLREREHLRQKKVYWIGSQAIHVQEEGVGKNDTALLIHGWSSSWYAMSPLLPTLNRRYHCLAVDLPGYGDSPRLPVRTTIELYADLLASLIKQVSNKPVVLVGHSMGGMISLTLAMRYPELVERMVLLCPTISGDLSLFINMFILPITVLERFSLASKLVAALEPQLLSVTDRLMRPASFAERTGISEADYHQLRADARRPGQGMVRAETFWAMRNGDLRGSLKKIKVPALVLWGMEDNTVPLRDASVVADEWPAAELRIIPKAGHWPQFETPDFTQRAIRAFLSTPIKLLKAQF